MGELRTSLGLATRGTLLYTLLAWHGCAPHESPAPPLAKLQGPLTVLVPCDAAELINALIAANAAGPGPHTLTLEAGCTYTLAAQNNFWYGPNALPPIASDITLGASCCKRSLLCPVSSDLSRRQSVLCLILDGS